MYCFFSILLFNRNSCLQVVQNLIRRDILQHLICVYTVYLGTKNRTLGTNRLSSITVIWATGWQNQQNDVSPAKTQISLGIRLVWSEFSLSAWRKLGSLATHWVHSEDWSDWADVFAGHTVILLVLSCCGSYFLRMLSYIIVSLYNAFYITVSIICVAKGVRALSLGFGPLLVQKWKLYVSFLPLIWLTASVFYFDLLFQYQSDSGCILNIAKWQQQKQDMQYWSFFGLFQTFFSRIRYQHGQTLY